MKSRTMQALERVKKGERVAVVAAALGLSKVAIYAAIKRREGKTICPCCGQVIRKELDEK